MSGRWRRVRSLVARLGLAVGVLGAPFLIPTTSAQFVGATGDAANQVTAATLAAPTGFAAGQTCAAGPGIAIRGATSATGLDSLTLTPPATTQAGDVMVAQVANRDGASTLTPPAGWTLVSRTSATTVTSAIYWKVATASESAVTWTLASANVQMVGGIAAYSGVNTTSPVHTSGFATGQGTTATAPSVTTTVANTMLVHTIIKRQEALAAPAGTTARWSLTSGTGSGMAGATAADVLFAGTGASTARSSSSGSNFITEWVAYTVALRPALGPPSASLTWTASSSSTATGYVLERVVSGAVQASKTVTPVSSTSTTDGTLVNGTTYTYRLRTYYGTWNSANATASLTPSC
jgi:hypothetical protein